MTGTATARHRQRVPASASRGVSPVATAVNMGGLGLRPPHRGLFRPARPPPSPPCGVRRRGPWACWPPRALRSVRFRTVSPRGRPAFAFAGLGIPTGAGRVRRGLRCRVARCLPARAVRRAGAPPSWGQRCTREPCGPGRRRVPLLAIGARPSCCWPVHQRRVVMAGLGVAAALARSSGPAQARTALSLGGDDCGRGGRGRRFLPGQPGHGHSPGAARAAHSQGHSSCLLRGVLRPPDHPRGWAGRGWPRSSSGTSGPYWLSPTPAIRARSWPAPQDRLVPRTAGQRRQ